MNAPKPIQIDWSRCGEMSVDRERTEAFPRSTGVDVERFRDMNLVESLVGMQSTI